MTLADVFARCAAQGRGALVGYLPAGYPTVDSSVELFTAAIEGGCDLVEVGIPYSDPVMDGPTIQAAADTALRAGFRVRDVFTVVERISAAGGAAVVMTYFNPVLRYGVDAFARDLAAAGGLGVITPDLIPDEADEWLAASTAHGLDRIFLVAPSSTEERIASTAAASSGFLYATSTMGVTGARGTVDTAAATIVARCRTHTALPIGVGLGVRSGRAGRRGRRVRRRGDRRLGARGRGGEQGRRRRARAGGRAGGRGPPGGAPRPGLTGRASHGAREPSGSVAWDDRRVATPAEGLARLRAAADTGELDALCRRHRIRVLTVFGSAAREEPAARDLDIGVLLERGAEIDYLGLIDDLQRITEANIDVVHLNPAGPVLRERALVGSVVLDESEPGCVGGRIDRRGTGTHGHRLAASSGSRSPGRPVTPRRLDVGTLGAKLRAMRRLLDELDRIGAVDVDRFAREFSTQLVVERIVSQLVDLAAGINTHVLTTETGESPPDVQRSFTAVADTGLIDHDLAERLAPSAGLRNVLIHAYVDLDLARLVAAVPLASEQYAEYVRQVARWVTDRNG